MATAAKLKEQAAAVLGSHKKGYSLVSHQKLRQLYVNMLKCRLLDERAAALLPQKNGNHPPRLSGQEAGAVGVTIDLHPEDTLAPSHGTHAVGFLKGVPLSTIFTPLYQKSNGVQNGHSPLAQNVVNSTSTLAVQLGIANGVALANKQRKNGNIAVAFTGHVASSLDSWHEALKFAGTHKLPILFVSPSGEGPEEDLSAKAQPYGYPCIPVDGADVVAVYRVAFESIARIRQGGGPTLIECKTYSRNSGSESELQSAKDPIENMENYLTCKGLFDAAWKQQVVASFNRELDEAARTARQARRS
jgi:2-oxoisovalerate dehydrogenase E1 component